MLVLIDSLEHQLVDHLSRDPVRPYINLGFRVGQGGESFALTDSDQVSSLICCAYKDSVPRSLDQLLRPNLGLPCVAVFYTVWSHRSGAGREIIHQVRSWIKQHRPFVQQFVTFSPPGESVRKFHIDNGAQVLNVNADSINYQY